MPIIILTRAQFRNKPDEYVVKRAMCAHVIHKKFLVFNVSNDFGAVTHNGRRFQFRLFKHLFRIVPGSWINLGYIAGDRRHNLKPKLAQVPAQSELNHSGYLVAAKHL